MRAGYSGSSKYWNVSLAPESFLVYVLNNRRGQDLSALPVNSDLKSN